MSKFVVDGHTVLVDDEDDHIVTADRWRCVPARGKLYVGRKTHVDGKSVHIHLHRSVAGKPPPGLVTDHINGNTLDNRRSNLRFVTQAENCQNLHKAKRSSKSGVLGVNWHKKSKKWRAQIRLNYATIHIGYFDDIDAASRAYLAKKRELHPASQL